VEIQRGFFNRSEPPFCRVQRPMRLWSCLISLWSLYYLKVQALQLLYISLQLASLFKPFRKISSLFITHTAAISTEQIIWQTKSATCGIAFSI
jgi:hypothetical protein